MPVNTSSALLYATTLGKYVQRKFVTVPSTLLVVSDVKLLVCVLYMLQVLRLLWMDVMQMRASLVSHYQRCLMTYTLLMMKLLRS